MYHSRFSPQVSSHRCQRSHTGLTGLTGLKSVSGRWAKHMQFRRKRKALSAGREEERAWEEKAGQERAWEGKAAQES
jgi:hypothetical protein